MAAATVMRTIRKYSAVRRPMVSPLPIAGGLAGYFTNGTANTAANPSAATSSAVARAERAPRRPYANANAMAKIPPRAVPYTTTATPSPSVDCTVRLTSSGPPMSAAACASSKAMARLMDGSPNSRPNRSASSPATAPTSIPRTSRERAVTAGSVAGEAEQVPAVVGELVHPLPAEYRQGALFGTDEVDGDHGEQQAEDGPGQQFPEGNGNGGGQGGGLRHENLLGITRPAR